MHSHHKHTHKTTIEWLRGSCTTTSRRTIHLFGFCFCFWKLSNRFHFTHPMIRRYFLSAFSDFVSHFSRQSLCAAVSVPATMHIASIWFHRCSSHQLRLHYCRWRHSGADSFAHWSCRACHFVTPTVGPSENGKNVTEITFGRCLLTAVRLATTSH